MLMQEKPKQLKFDEEYTERLLGSLQTIKGVYSELLIKSADNHIESISRFMVDDFTQYLFSTTSTEVSLINTIKQNEQYTNIEDTITRLIQIRDTYMMRFNRPKSSSIEEIIEQIKQYGYRTFMNLLMRIEDKKSR